MQCSSTLIFLFPSLYYAALCIYEFSKREGKHLWNSWAALQFFSQIIMTGHSWRRAWKSWRTTRTPPSALADSTKPLSLSAGAQRALMIRWGKPVCETCHELRSVGAWRAVSRSPESSWGSYLNEGGGGSCVFLCFITLWPSEGHFPGKSSRCGLMKIQAFRWWSGLFIFSVSL